MRADLQAAINAGIEQGRTALYFGCWDRSGHYLHRPGGMTVWDAKEQYPGFPWGPGLMDGGLLKNGKRADVPDGRVWARRMKKTHKQRKCPGCDRYSIWEPK